MTDPIYEPLVLSFLILMAISSAVCIAIMIRDEVVKTRLKNKPQRIARLEAYRATLSIFPQKAHAADEYQHDIAA